MPAANPGRLDPGEHVAVVAEGDVSVLARKERKSSAKDGTAVCALAGHDGASVVVGGHVDAVRGQHVTGGGKRTAVRALRR